MDWLADPQAWMAFATLTLLEIVLGIDNVVFIAILVDKLPEKQHARARTIGLGLAMLMRIGLLFSLSWVMQFTAPLFAVLEHEISGRDVILLCGGLFLIAKATHEIHQKLEGEEGHVSAAVSATMTSVLIQITILVVSVIFMMIFASAISAFVNHHPTVKMLALSFLLLIGVLLIAEGCEQHLPKGYIYFAMAFSVFVEMLNLQVRKPRASPVQFHQAYR